MRLALFLTAFMFAVMSLPQQSHARCSLVDEDLCATENGHYRIRTPKGRGPFPTVLYLYGSTGNSGTIVSNKRFVDAFVSRGYAVIVPAALDVRYADGLDSGWHLRHERGSKQRDEIAFVAEVLRDAATSFVIDRRNVLIAGMSRGGFLAWEIACHRPDLARAYAPVASGYLGPMPERCQSPVRLLHTHGRADTIVPLDPAAPWSSAGARALPLNTILGRMAGTGGCTARGEAKAFKDYTRTSWAGCQRNASVDLLVHNGGHTIPASWYPSVIDWFEEGNKRPSQLPQGGGTAVFRGAGQNSGGGVFKGVGERATGGRFKKVPGTQ